MAKKIFKKLLLSALLCFLSVYSIKGEDDVCVEETACLCKLNDDRIIDISNITKDEPLSVSKGHLTYFFYPCTNYLYNEKHIASLKINTANLTNGCSNGTSLCLYDAEKPSLTDLGQTKDATFSRQARKSLIYTNKLNVSTIIQLDCTPDETNSYLIIPANQPADSHRLILFSQHACIKFEQRGLSTGSTLLILFFTGFAIYLAGGAIVLHLMRGAQGKEMIPNLDFWTGLPGLVRDGTIYLLSGCNTQTVATVETYDRI